MSQATPLSACAIAVMAKASSPGRTKTRLAPPLTLEEAAQINTVFLRDIVENITAAAGSASISSYLAYGPPGSEPFFREMLPPVDGLIEVWLGDFGACLFATIQALLEKGHAAACVLNSDSPTLPTAILTDLAARLLGPEDKGVIGPADDGGYYVLGLKAAHRRLFEDVDWSTDRVFDQTMARAAELGLPMEILPRWYDVDDADGLKTLEVDLFETAPERPAIMTPSAAPHTRAFLEGLLTGGRLQHPPRLFGAGLGS